MGVAMPHPWLIMNADQHSAYMRGEVVAGNGVKEPLEEVSGVWRCGSTRCNRKHGSKFSALRCPKRKRTKKECAVSEETRRKLRELHASGVYERAHEVLREYSATRKKPK